MKTCIITFIVCLFGPVFVSLADDSDPNQWPSATPASTQQVDDATGSSGENISFIQNDTYLANPSGLLGNVLVLRTNDPTSTRTNPTFEIVGLQGFNVTPTSTYDHSVVQSLIVNQSLSLSSSFMSFFKADLSASNMLNMTIRNEVIQRITVDSNLVNALQTWKNNNTNLLSDTNIQYILVVRGFVLKSANYQNYSQVNGDASGAYGVSVGGTFYSSSAADNIQYIWGVDYGVIRGPSDTIDRVKQLTLPRSPTSLENKDIFERASGVQILRQSNE